MSGIEDCLIELKPSRDEAMDEEAVVVTEDLFIVVELKVVDFGGINLAEVIGGCGNLEAETVEVLLEAGRR